MDASSIVTPFNDEASMYIQRPLNDPIKSAQWNKRSVMFDQIPVEVLEQYEGKWIVWDQDDRKVVGCGATLDEAEDQAAQAPEDHLLRVHHVLPQDWEIVGML